MRWRTAVGVVALSSLVACGEGPPSAPDAEIAGESADSEIRSILETYQRVVTEADPDLLMTIWDDSEGISFVNPSERVQSIEELRGFVVGLGESFSDREIIVSNVSIHESGDAAWSVFDWAFTATMPDGSPFESTGWETHVYRKTEGGWRIAHVHYSVPFVLPEAE